MQSLREAAADMACYMGPTAGVSKILEKLSVIFGTVVSFDVLMQNFYKILQGNEKVPLFATRLEGTLNQIRIKCPSRIANHEVSSHLKGWLFHGVKKHVRDSVRYLYSHPQTTYSELVVAARRAESETEETKVKVRSATATEVPSSLKELGVQIARLMATLTRQNRIVTLLVPQAAKGTGVVGGDGWTGTLLSALTPTMVGLAWAKPPLAAPPWSTRLVLNPHIREIKTCRPEYRTVHGCPAMFQVSRLGPYGPRVCNTCNAVKQGRGDPRECSQTPLKLCTVNSKHSLCNPKPKLTQDEAARKRGWKELTPIPFLNPNLVAHLVGCTNEAPVVMDGCEVAALVDSGAQVSTMSAQLCEELGLKFNPWVGCWNSREQGVQPSLTSDL